MLVLYTGLLSQYFVIAVITAISDMVAFVIDVVLGIVTSDILTALVGVTAIPTIARVIDNLMALTVSVGFPSVVVVISYC